MIVGVFVGVDVGTVGVGDSVAVAVGDTTNATLVGGSVGARVGTTGIVGVGVVAGVDEQAAATEIRTSASASEKTLFMNSPGV